MYLALNGNYELDPRASIKWNLTNNQSLSFGFGQHSQTEALRIYLIRRVQNGQVFYPNKNLDLSRARHFVLSYDWMIRENVHLRIEPYYQYLYDIPGIPSGSWSMINFTQDWTFRDSLSNCSSGINKGIDLTLERYLKRNYYYMLTASVFDSRYKAGDGIWRNTRFDKSFAFNILFGKEFIFGRNILGVNARLSLTGGERISPLMSEQSLTEKRVIYDEFKAFANQLPGTYNFDFTLTYRTNRKNYSGIWALQVKNMLGTPNFNGYEYNYKTQTIESVDLVIILPVLSYKIEF
jgi:hypothetical protein